MWRIRHNELVSWVEAYFSNQVPQTELNSLQLVSGQSKKLLPEFRLVKLQRELDAKVTDGMSKLFSPPEVNSLVYL
ncbi:hypothetical protein DXT99_08130 [Pontibacter diazotrophicus]|uniref:Uncharacterized protein n=1 Tax=Pontibacter diazotrophicus TaxID=1400979 RepID=A0A3D8LDN0_9BACT|nr:hypothetical protein [Pontibacter diazotrophicus]RDV15453.1 hypothetical protein DXT99_08130 [Pontibacter diazotrophicus]